MTLGQTPEQTPTQTSPRLIRNHYKVLSILGEGGFGKTFLVEDTHLPSKRRCVLKQLKPVQTSAEMAQLVRDRFEREATTLERLGEAHEQVPRLYAHFEENGEFYLVEEWIDGLTLTQKVQKEGPLSEDAVTRILAELLPVIEFIHQQKMVHRDIKPDNVLLRSPDEKPVLIDFGAVKESIRTVMLNSGTQSTPSIVVGTPGYMPMEQMAGRPVYASDIYSLGMTAIFLLTGKQPHEFGSDPQTGLLDWRSHAPSVSPHFASFLDRATHMTPQSRFSNLQEMQSALMQQHSGVTHASYSAATAATTASNAPSTVVNHQTKVVAPAQSIPSAIPTPNPSPKRSFKGPLIIGGLAGLSVLLGGFWVQNKVSEMLSGQPIAPSDVVSVETEAASEETTDEGKQTINTNTSSARVIEPRQDNAQSIDQPTDATDSAEQQSESVASSTASPTATTTSQSPPPETTTAFLVDLPGDSIPNANALVIGSSSSYRIQISPSDSSIEGYVDRGSHIRVLQSKKDGDGYPWYQVLVPSGAQGWIPAHVVQVVDKASGTIQLLPKNAIPNSNALVIGTSSSYRVQKSPSDSSTEGYVDRGSYIRVTNYKENNEGYPWYEVLTPKGDRGWIPEQVVRLNDGATLSIPEASSSVPQS